MKWMLSVAVIALIVSPLMAQNVYKSVELRKFARSEGVELSPEFPDLLQTTIKHYLENAEQFKEILAEGEAASSPDPAQTLSIEGTLLKFKKGTGAKIGGVITGAIVPGGGLRLTARVIIRRRINQESLFDKSLIVYQAINDKEDILAASLAEEIAKQITALFFKEPVWPSVSAKGTARVDSNKFGMEFVTIRAGQFAMGRSRTNHSCFSDKESPEHEMRITRDFQLQITEVTQLQWKRVMGTNPSQFKGDDLPVETISWYDAQKFLAKLNELDDGYLYRLPSEAEWEYAASGGTPGGRYGKLDRIAWNKENSLQLRFRWPPENELAVPVTHGVKKKLPNRYGLYDMLGNVEEWCGDWYDKDYYSYSPLENPKGPPSGKSKVTRGGSSYSLFCEVTRFARGYRRPEATGDDLGFRCAREPR